LFTRRDSWHRRGEPVNVAARMASAFGEPVVETLRMLGRRAHEVDVGAFLVGGCVRDLLLGEEIRDIDILIEGDAISFARSLGDQVTRLRKHDRFGTASITLKNGLGIDLASARRESYEHPAALPDVEHASVREDLHRRDFTINAMAVSIGPDDFGLLLDFFGGLQDLHDRLIRVLHSRSFVDDPTRVLRAIRLEKRLGFRMEAATESLARDSATEKAFRRLSGQRFRDELIAILEDRAPAEAVRRMTELDVLRLLHPALSADEDTLSLIQRCEEVFDWQRGLPEAPLRERWPCLLLMMLMELSAHHRRELLQRLRLSRRRAQELLVSAEAVPELEKKLGNPNLRPSQIYNILAPLPGLAGIGILARTDDSAAGAAVRLYFEQLRLLEADIDGRTLQAAGYKPGPSLAEALKAARAAKMDGEAPTAEVQEAVARKVLDDLKQRPRGSPDG